MDIRTAGLVEPLQQPLPVLRPGDPAQRSLEIVLTGGVLDVGKELGPFAHQVIAPAHQVPRGPHLLRVDVGHGDQAAPRSKAAIFWESILSFLLLPPWMARM